MNDEIDNETIRPVRETIINRMGLVIDVSVLREALQATDLVPAQRLRDAEARAERLEAAAIDVLSAFEPASVVHIGSPHYKYSAAWPTHIRNPVQRLRDALAPQDSTPERNQCDGCARGLPIDEHGIHRGDGYDVIVCTADRYTSAESGGDHE